VRGRRLLLRQRLRRLQILSEFPLHEQPQRRLRTWMFRDVPGMPEWTVREPRRLEGLWIQLRLELDLLHEWPSGLSTVQLLQRRHVRPDWKELRGQPLRRHERVLPRLRRVQDLPWRNLRERRYQGRMQRMQPVQWWLVQAGQQPVWVQRSLPGLDGEVPEHMRRPRSNLLSGSDVQ
jgi:hypothetical protein